MAAESRRPRDERILPADGDSSGEAPSPRDGGGETLAEKIRRYRQPGRGASGGPPAPGGRVVRSPREE